MTNIKDTLTTYCGIVVAICGSILGLQATGMVFPEWVTLILVVLGSIATGLIGWANGKNANLTPKTDAQIAAQNGK